MGSSYGENSNEELASVRLPNGINSSLSHGDEYSPGCGNLQPDATWRLVQLKVAPLSVDLKDIIPSKLSKLGSTQVRTIWYNVPLPAWRYVVDCEKKSALSGESETNTLALL